MSDKKKDAALPKIDSFDYHLSTPIKYSDGGQSIPTDVVTIVAPGEKLCIKAFKLCQMMTSANIKAGATVAVLNKIMDAPETQKLIEEKKAKEAKSFDVKTIIKEGSETCKTVMIASDVDLEKGIAEFKKLAKEGCVMVAEKPLNYIQWKALSNLDIMEMFFQFCGVFISPSL